MIRLILLVGILASAGVAFAKPDAKATEAKERFESGMAHFNLREFGPAIEDFEAGYRLRPDPVFLYNLGQAHRLAEHPEQALYFYRAYLRNSPNADNRAVVEERIAGLDKQLADKRAAESAVKSATVEPATAPAPAVVPAVVSVATMPAARPRPIYKRWWLWTVVGGVAVAGAAVGLGVGLSRSGPSFNAGLGTVGPAALGTK